MDRFERIYRLHQALKAHRHPVSCRRLQELLECSESTVKRTVQSMRLYLRAPINYDRKLNGYHYEPHRGDSFELPGLWFNASELHALLTVQQLLRGVQPGLLDEKLLPLRRHIDQLLINEQAVPGDLSAKVRILAQAARPVRSELFQTVAGAVLQERRLRIAYHGRDRDTASDRDVSPQRLVHYRDNWYLDSWCHRASALRSFALDRIRSARQLDAPIKKIAASRLKAHFTRGYGIFAGTPRNTARLRFSASAARWVADERWHSQQRGERLEDGAYLLELPYADDRELLLEILKWGAEVEVLAPDELRHKVARQPEGALRQYHR